MVILDIYNLILVSLGLDDTDSTKSTLDIYVKYFETPFVKDSDQFYAVESKTFMNENSTSEYMKKVATLFLI